MTKRLFKFSFLVPCLRQTGVRNDKSVELMKICMSLVPYRTIQSLLFDVYRQIAIRTCAILILSGGVGWECVHGSLRFTRNVLNGFGRIAKLNIHFQLFPAKPTGYPFGVWTFDVAQHQFQRAIIFPTVTTNHFFGR